MADKNCTEKQLISLSKVERCQELKLRAKQAFVQLKVSLITEFLINFTVFEAKCCSAGSLPHLDGHVPRSHLSGCGVKVKISVIIIAIF